jgi:hypothetical protein
LACAVHGRCTPERRLDLVPWCLTCPNYEPVREPFTGPVVRNLLYHIYPVRGGNWRWNVEQLLRRIGLFNGRRVVAIACDEPGSRLPEDIGPFAPDPVRLRADSVPAEEVQEAFRGEVQEFLLIRNDPRLREVASFLSLFERVQTLDPNHVTLYAHAKGSTRPAGHLGAGRWAETLYEVCLDYWPVVERQLQFHPLTGAFLKRGAGWHSAQSHSDWQYSGSWFWFRNHHLFRRPDWRTIDPFWSGIEPYPSLHFHYADAGSLFHVGAVPSLNLYSRAYWDEVVEPDLALWRRRHQGQRTNWLPPSFSWLGPFREVQRAWDAAGLLRATSAEEMAMIADDLAELAAGGVAGDVLECGCWTGFSTCCLSQACAGTGRRLIVADSFAGLPDPGHSTAYRPGDFAAPREVFQANLERFGRPDVVDVVPGWFAATLRNWERPLCLLWLDVDLRASVRTVLEGTWGALAGGGRLWSHECEPDDFAAGRIRPRCRSEVWDEVRKFLVARGERGTARHVTGCLGRFDRWPTRAVK